jgi:hypothetical protein
MNKKNNLGIDRAIPLYWANYALELSMSNQDMAENYSRLKEELHKQSESSETPRKIANHLKQLWFNQTDELGILREEAATIIRQNENTEMVIFHLGMACNAFPLFHQVCQKIGELIRVSASANSKQITERILQVYATPTTIPPAVSRVIQTLVDWKLIKLAHGEISQNELKVTDPTVGAWLIRALMIANSRVEIPLHDLDLLPELLGVHFLDLRDCIRQSDGLAIRHGAVGEELICIKD